MKHEDNIRTTRQHGQEPIGHIHVFHGCIHVCRTCKFFVKYVYSQTQIIAGHPSVRIPSLLGYVALMMCLRAHSVVAFHGFGSEQICATICHHKVRSVIFASRFHRHQ